MWTYRICSEGYAGTVVRTSLREYFWNAFTWSEDGVPEKLGEGVASTKKAALDAVAEALAGVVRDRVLDLV